MPSSCRSAPEVSLQLGEHVCPVGWRVAPRREQTQRANEGNQSSQLPVCTSCDYWGHMANGSTHVEGTVRALAQLRDEHERKATPLQRIVSGLTGRAASPGFVFLLTAILLLWMGVNSALFFLGKKPVDEPPFFWMQGAVSLAALYMTVLILATQRRENELASHHEHLTLELAILSEQKTAKIIALLEELRQDHPDIHDRIDREAATMSEPADPQAVIETIKKRSAH
jgi:uncharacterized membrane protein